MRYYLIAGEASGDLHGSLLVEQIHLQDSKAVIRCWGGDKMQQAGAQLVKHYKDLAFMGFVEVVKHLPTILKNLRFCKRDIANFKPDVIVFIDYPGFNLRIAPWAKSKGFPTVYFISPQIWAWKEGRVEQIKKYIDRMLVVLPFEKTFYKKHGYEVTYVGHPLIQVIEKAKRQPLIPLSTKKIIALLPGSRKQEILQKLPIMLSIREYFPEYEFIVATAPSVPEEFYLDILGHNGAKLTRDGSYNLLRQAEAALVTSGTATLETALFNVPQVVCYKGNAISYQIAKRLIKVRYISLVNLIVDRLIVEELIQDNLTKEMLRTELERLLHSREKRTAIFSGYNQLYQLLSGHSAPECAAQEIITLAKKG